MPSIIFPGFTHTMHPGLSLWISLVLRMRFLQNFLSVFIQEYLLVLLPEFLVSSRNHFRNLARNTCKNFSSHFLRGSSGNYSTYLLKTFFRNSFYRDSFKEVLEISLYIFPEIPLGSVFTVLISVVCHTWRNQAVPCSIFRHKLSHCCKTDSQIIKSEKRAM